MSKSTRALCSLRALQTGRSTAYKQGRPIPCCIAAQPSYYRFLSRTALVRNDQSKSNTPSEQTRPEASKEAPKFASISTSDVRKKVEELANHAAVTAIVNASKERTRQLRTRFDSRLSDASERWNTYSGYAAVEELKLQIVQLETSLQEARSTLDLAKQSYVKSVADRSTSQKEINDLLSRKSIWTDADLHRYTELLRQEHHLHGAEQRGEAHLEQATAHVQSAFDQLMKTVLLRYHEEQIWSDRVRGLSTWGSLLVAGLNAALFLMAILLVEPYKRKKLAHTFETRLLQGEEQSRTLITNTIAEFEDKLERFAQLQYTRQEQQPLPAEVSVLPQDQPFFVDNVAPTQTQEDIMGLDVGITSATQEPTSISEDSRSSQRGAEENIVYASTVGVVVGALLSTLLGFCWN